ncbi:MAG: FecR domain-containing protein [Acidobacteriota bacterium]|nr:FecR domain-containing protein [Acidobacteriota bacterium]
MKKTISVLAVALAALGAAPEPETNESFTYNVVAVKRRLLLASTGGELELKEGDKAQSGASLRTGSRSSADLVVAERAARFHIGTKTRFHLAAGKPGVLIDVERGSLRAVFGKLPEGDQGERLVTTPSAVLAVRGTDYGVEVEKDGDTTVVVFEGTVEIRDLAGLGDTLQVSAGQSTRIRKGRPPSAPTAHSLSTTDWDRGRRSERSLWNDSQNQAPGERGAAGQSGATRQGAESAPARPQQGGSTRHGG